LKNVYALELWHGPSLAFKDFGARFMSRVMSHFWRKAKSSSMFWWQHLVIRAAQLRLVFWVAQYPRHHTLP